MQILVLTGVLALYISAAYADSAARPENVPVQAELLADIQVHKLAVGAIFYARVTAEWRGVGCNLRSGAILEGHVLSIVPYSKPDKISQVDLAFTGAQCFGREMNSFNLLLAAIAAPQRELDLGILTDPVPNPVPLPIGASAAPDAGFKLIANSQSMHLDTRIDFDKPTYQFQNQTMRIGEVSGIHGMKLGVGAGLENSSVVSQKGHNLWLERHTQLFLLPAPAPSPRALPTPDAASAAASAPSERAIAESVAAAPTAAVAPVSGNPAPPASPPVDDVDLCEPPQCNLALPSGDAMDARKPDASISVLQLGYSPRPQRIFTSFDNDEALAWLAPNELLVAFNPHILVHRRPLGPSGSTERVIRALLLDATTRQVIYTVDWELPDDSEYLWPLGNGTVLVHVASELRVYGKELEVQKRIPLDGPLAFVRVTPDGTFIAVGVVHERHTPQLHALLKESLQNDPEEDVNTIVFNRDFEMIAQSTSGSAMLPPTLLNEGEARLTAFPGMHYRISLHTWYNNTSTLASFNSSCTPEFTSLAPDLIFLVHCDGRSEAREYRVLRSDGKLALKRGASPNDCGGQSAASSANKLAFVIKTVESLMPVAQGGPISAASLASEELAVYRAVDGRRLFEVRIGAPSSSRNNYALAPDGSQLAVLTREQISIYSMPSM
jgi:hypothetical protein